MGVKVVRTTPVSDEETLEAIQNGIDKWKRGKALLIKHDDDTAIANGSLVCKWMHSTDKFEYDADECDLCTLFLKRDYGDKDENRCSECPLDKMGQACGTVGSNSPWANFANYNTPYNAQVMVDTLFACKSQLQAKMYVFATKEREYKINALQTTLKATIESRDHWGKNMSVFMQNERTGYRKSLVRTIKFDNGDTIDYGTDACSLCKMFIQDGFCGNCPLAKADMRCGEGSNPWTAFHDNPSYETARTMYYALYTEVLRIDNEIRDLTLAGLNLSFEEINMDIIENAKTITSPIPDIESVEPMDGCADKGVGAYFVQKPVEVRDKFIAIRDGVGYEKGHIFVDLLTYREANEAMGITKHTEYPYYPMVNYYICVGNRYTMFGGQIFFNQELKRSDDFEKYVPVWEPKLDEPYYFLYTDNERGTGLEIARCVETGDYIWRDHIDKQPIYRTFEDVQQALAGIKNMADTLSANSRTREYKS